MCIIHTKYGTGLRQLVYSLSWWEMKQGTAEQGCTLAPAVKRPALLIGPCGTDPYFTARSSLARGVLQSNTSNRGAFLLLISSGCAVQVFLIPHWGHCHMLPRVLMHAVHCTRVPGPTWGFSASVQPALCSPSLFGWLPWRTGVFSNLLKSCNNSPTDLLTGLSSSGLPSFLFLCLIE